MNGQLIPSLSEALHLYRTAGGLITEECSFGIDPLHTNPDKQNIRHAAFLNIYQFSNIFGNVVQGDGSTFKDAILFFVNITYCLSV